MKFRRNNNFRGRIAPIAAILLLIAQTIAVAHSHRMSAQQEFASSVAASIADGSCAICAAQIHSPAASSALPAPNAPTVPESVVPIAFQTVPFSTLIPKLFGRAPPATV
jgi:hypothetical protein